MIGDRLSVVAHTHPPCLDDSPSHLSTSQQTLSFARRIVRNQPLQRVFYSFYTAAATLSHPSVPRSHWRAVHRHSAPTGKEQARPFTHTPHQRILEPRNVPGPTSLHSNNTTNHFSTRLEWISKLDIGLIQTAPSKKKKCVGYPRIGDQIET